MVIKKITNEEWVANISDSKEDNFAKTFASKANARGYWDDAYGCFIDGELCGGIITTYSKRAPKTANLQLLHTFAKHRFKGVAKHLTEFSYKQAASDGCIYYRVSAEKKAVAFYEKIGFKFWGQQKSGTSLSMFKIASDVITEGIYDENDAYIYKKVYEMPGKIVVH